MKPGLDPDREKAGLQEPLDKHNPEWVWQYRLKLVAERVFMRDLNYSAPHAVQIPPPWLLKGNCPSLHQSGYGSGQQARTMLRTRGKHRL